MPVVYRFVCPGFKSCYIGKTDHTLHERAKENAYAKGNKTKKAQFMNICHLVPITVTLQIYSRHTNSFNSNQFNVSQIRENAIILDKGKNQNVLISKELLMIKKHRPLLNCSLTASKELPLF